jgi:uncharacterized protein (TIGR03437 family)
MGKTHMPARLVILFVSLLPVCLAQTTPALQLSATSFSFTALAAGNAPPPQWLTVHTADGSPLAISIRTDGGEVSQPAPPWLNVAPLTIGTPGRVRIAVDPASLQQGANNARLLITDSQGRALAPPIPISVTGAAGAPQLAFSPEFVKLSGVLTASSISAPLLVRNTGTGGSVTAAVASATPWLRIAPAGPCGARECIFRVAAAVTGLEPGTYQGTVRVTTAIGSRDIPVSLLLHDRVPVLSLFPNGVAFEARQGTTLAQTKTVAIRNTGEGAMTWFADLPGARWLAAAATAEAVSPGAPGSLTLIANAGGLAAGNYSTVLNVRSSGGSVTLPVRLRVTAPGTSPVLDLSPAGLLIKTTAGAEAPVRPVAVQSNTSDTINYQASAQVNEAAGGAWLSVTPTRGAIPDRDRIAPSVFVTIAAAPLNLRQGVYTGEAVFAPGSSDSTALNVAAAVLPGAGAAACVAQSLALVHTTLPGNFRVRAGNPVPVAVQLMDDCGGIPDAVVALLFSTGETLQLADQGSGVWGATWVPRTPAAWMTVTAKAYTERLPVATAEVGGVVLADTQPLLYQGGVVNNRNPISGGALAPGTIVEIYGSNLAAGGVAGSFSGGRLPVALGDATVSIGGFDAPLFFVSPGQINAQVPYELEAGKQYALGVTSRGIATNTETIAIAAASPGIAAFSDGRAIAQNANFELIGPDRPARAGDYVVVYLTGLGATSPAAQTGLQAPSAPLAQAARSPQLLLDGRPAEILFAGLSPGFTGLYQINFRIAPDQAAGDVRVVVVQGSARSNEVTLPVR